MYDNLLHPLSIKQDQGRFRQIVRGQVKRDLKKFMSNGELIGRQGKDTVSIPVPQIDLPRFRFNRKQQGGVGQGDGQPGQPIGPGQPGDQEGPAGTEPGRHMLEVDVPLSELAEILGEELELPRIEPKNNNNIETQAVRYTGMRRVGPEGLRYFKRTYREALKRQMASGTYDPAKPRIIPIRDDMRYRSWKTYPKPQSNAVVIYMMDVSGSMTRSKKELVRLCAFWIDTWLRSQYENIKVRYIVHDAAAKEVDQHTFYHLRESGGTLISSAYQLCWQIITAEYNPADWNLYAFHFSDGENASDADDKLCLDLLREQMIPALNLFAYGQVKHGYGQEFIETLGTIDDEKMVSSRINTNNDIYSAIKTFLGKGL